MLKVVKLHAVQVVPIHVVNDAKTAQMDASLVVAQDVLLTVLVHVLVIVVLVLILVVLDVTQVVL